ncbi:MAG TPA: HD domain-containing protein [Thermodesulfovibrionales bacterium]|nr:HD domain-containing protein [Thermodesulfovibrionales bacterium]
MTKEELDFFKTWFDDYTASFRFPEKKDQSNVLLKVKHTRGVCGNIMLLAKALSLDGSEAMLAESIGLFHDIGRFLQYQKYRTFRDSVSENHAVLGVTILSESGVLKKLPGREQDIILFSVKFHNSLAMPDLQDDDRLLFLKLIRDADKLDIYRVFGEYYELPEEERASAAGLELPDAPGYSRDVLACIFERKIATLSSLRTLNDFKLMKLSWIYDLNFRASLQLLRERNYVGKLLETMPGTEELDRVLLFLEDYMDKRLSEIDRL